MKTYEIETASLAAAITHAPKVDIRTYLVGVYVDTDKGRLVATDGHRMFVCSCPAVRRDFEPPFIIPRALIATAVKAAKKNAWIAVTVEPAGEFQRVTLNVNGSSFSELACDGTYPQYQRVIPTNLSGAPGWYNPTYLADAHAALDTFHGYDSQARVYYNGADKACIVTSPLVNALVVIMPMRVGDNPEANPALDWLHNPAGAA